MNIDIDFLHSDNLFSILSNLQSNLIRIDFPNIEWIYRDKWLINGTKHNKDNQSQNLKHPCRIF